MPLELRPLEISEELMERLLRREEERLQKDRSQAPDFSREPDQTDRSRSSNAGSPPASRDATAP